ncbi:hypothetical protein BDL97_06G034500 [Sphagnum fallax]|nr:hypothetical protein BDL97_06G034500 [Sphagnum fallax]
MTNTNYFQLSSDEVKRLLKKKKSLQINQNQCRLLTEKLGEILAKVDGDIRSLPDEERIPFCEQQCKGALEELYRVTTEAGAILRACRNKDWLHAAVKLVDETHTFVEFFFELDWCAAVIRIVASDARTDTTSNHLHRDMIEGFTTAECARKREAIRGMLKKAALEDHGILRKTLLELQQRGGVSDEQVGKLVQNLLKLEPPPFDDKKKGAFLPNIEPTELVSGKKRGAGASGVVYEVLWLGQSFAKKKVYGTFKDEAEILAGLSHPNIVRLFGVSTPKREDGSSLIMELMSGDLYDCIHSRGSDQSEPFELAVALDIMLQTAEGMQYLYHKRIVHRDVKSLNILVDPVENLAMAEKGYLRVKVTDFGLAKIKAASATSSSPKEVGTTRWMAPELHTSSHIGESSHPGPNKKYHPFKADVYSYAITCSEILTGEDPFMGEPLTGLLDRIKYTGLRPSLPDSLPPYLVSLIHRCWDAAPCKRPDFSEICAELRHVKASLLIGGEKLVQAMKYPLSATELYERKTMYQAFLAAAEVETNHVTRVLVIGSSTKLLTETTVMAQLCKMNPTVLDSLGPDLLDLGSETMDINREWKHPTLPLCIHVSNGTGDNRQLERINKFLEERNLSWTWSSWLAQWKVLLWEVWNHDNEQGQQPMMDTLNSSNRIHAVWILHPIYENIQCKWILLLKKTLSDYELPIQIVIADSDSDPMGEDLQRNILDKRQFLFPNVPALPDHFIVVPLKKSTRMIKSRRTEDLKGQMIHHPQMFRQLKQFDHKALWASSEVIDTMANIKCTAQIICQISSRLRKHGITIPMTTYSQLPKSYSLTYSGIFTLKCLCEIFQVPKKMEVAMFRKLVSWEMDGATPFSLGDGKYLQFSIRIAAVILYFKALHCKGRTHSGLSDTDYSSELDNFYKSYGNRFEEFVRNVHFGIWSKIRKMLHSSNFNEQLQIFLKRFFINVINCSP